MSNDSSKDTHMALETPHKSHKWGWSPLTVILIVVFNYFFAQLLGGLLVSIYPYIKGWSTTRSDNWLNNNPFAQFLFVLFSEAITLLVIWLFVRRRVALKLLG